MIMCAMFFACSQSSPGGGPASSDGQIVNSTSPSAPEAISVSAKDFVDSFVETQKCVLKELSTHPNIDATKKPSSEDLAKITKALEDKSQNSQTSDAAWNDLTKGCNNAEINSIHSFFQCQQTACADTNPSSANTKHKACAMPNAGDGCKASFGQFMYRFSPL